jgi:hypothetical protein
MRAECVRDVLPQPGDELVEAELICFVERGYEVVRLLNVSREPCPIDGEKRIGGGERRVVGAGLSVLSMPTCRLSSAPHRLILRGAHSGSAE